MEISRNLKEELGWVVDIQGKFLLVTERQAS